MEVIINQWEKLFGRLMIQAGRINDAKMKKQLLKIVTVPKHIQVHVLSEYVDQCKQLYQIAFYQYRSLHPGPILHD